jgi:hypothetical protein
MYKYNFFYRTQNLVNGKFYYGIHSSDNLQDGYLGSGKALKLAIKKYGAENFLREILIFFDSREKAFEYEEKFLNEKIINNPQCYNISKGGNRGGDTSGLVNVYNSISGKNQMISINDPRYISGELKPVLKGFVIVKDLDGSIKKVRVDNEDYLTGILKPTGIKPKGPNKNKSIGTWKLSKDAKNKIGIYREGKFWDDNTKQKISESNKGHTRQSGKKHSQYGKKWVFNPINNKRLLIDKKDIDNFLTIGWVLGRKIKDK